MIEQERTPRTEARRDFLKNSLLATAVAAGVPEILAGAAAGPELSRPAAKLAAFELEEITIAALQQGMKAGKYTARGIAEKYLARIAALDKHGPAVNSVIEVNPDALALAEASDRERKGRGARGPLQGIPMLIKDNIDTADKMMTTAGSLALVGSKVPKDSVEGQRPR